MKIINISISEELECIDIENGTVDVSVELSDGYTYKLRFATPKYIEFLIDKEKMDYYRPSYPFNFVSKLTREVIEQGVKDLLKYDAYWLKVYHFAGSLGMIDKSTFDKLKTNHSKEKLNDLDD
jgi:hypothetical protein|uniref:Uncharacterized protein n=1 Tax=Fistulifera solaris TaxID=1519565 RepID=F3Y7B8_FISSO|nr:hypothetical protein FispC_p032 [Fistulifera solaris]YP_004376656.1 hypothetical protein FispC_p091 [Fistulifera solaris]BAK18963.1 hypothetical protein [Fistulifera solaris]BAK19022.1 hypothetical protein [Fistulifera solaris]